MPIPNQIRYFNKRVLNKLMIRIAGKRYSPISIVIHKGRRSGKLYRTPVIAERAQNAFVFALTYGPGVDWYRNLLAAGECSLVQHGQEYHLVQPETLPVDEALRAFPLPARWLLRLIGMRDFFRMSVKEVSSKQ